MSENVQVVKKPQSVKAVFNSDAVQKKFQEILKDNSKSYITSVLQIVSQNEKLAKCEPNSIVNAAMVSATLDLPMNNNLGFAYIVPYNESFKLPSGEWGKRQRAQFQMGYKGFKQLAIRSGQYKNLDSKKVYEGQYVEDDSFGGYHFDWKGKKSDKVVGYASYFLLHSGFESIKFMTTEEVEEHANTYSQTYSDAKTKKNSRWAKDFDKMALKTVTKLHLNSGEAPLSVEMRKAIDVDQAVVNNEEGTDLDYADHEDVTDVQELAEEAASKAQSAAADLIPEEKK